MMIILILIVLIISDSSNNVFFLGDDMLIMMTLLPQKWQSFLSDLIINTPYKSGEIAIIRSRVGKLFHDV